MKLGIRHHFHMGKALHGNSKHAQEQPLTPKGRLYSDGNFSELKVTGPSPIFSSSLSSFSFVSLFCKVSPLLLI